MLCLFMVIIFMQLVFMCHFVSQEKLNNKIGDCFIYISFKKLASAVLGICFVLRFICMHININTLKIIFNCYKHLKTTFSRSLSGQETILKL